MSLFSGYIPFLAFSVQFSVSLWVITRTKSDLSLYLQKYSPIPCAFPPHDSVVCLLIYDFYLFYATMVQRITQMRCCFCCLPDKLRMHPPKVHFFPSRRGNISMCKGRRKYGMQEQDCAGEVFPLCFIYFTSHINGVTFYPLCFWT